MSSMVRGKQHTTNKCSCYQLWPKASRRVNWFSYHPRGKSWLHRKSRLNKSSHAAENTGALSLLDNFPRSVGPSWGGSQPQGHPSPEQEPLDVTENSQFWEVILCGSVCPNSMVKVNHGQSRWSPPNLETNPTFNSSNQYRAQIMASFSSLSLLWL